jgi:DNA-binding transcriptional MerR regulator
MAELSRSSGVPTATIKYYMREGLLPGGEATAPNQARYGEQHLERLSLIRALREAAGLPVATIARVLTAMDDRQRGTTPEHLTIAVSELSEPLVVAEEDAEDFERATGELAQLLGGLGWDVDPDSPGRNDAVRSLVDIHRYLPGLVSDPSELRPYAIAVRNLANTEIPDDFDPSLQPARALRYSVLGTVLFEPLITALRKLAHVDRIRTNSTRAGAQPHDHT